MVTLLAVVVVPAWACTTCGSNAKRVVDGGGIEKDNGDGDGDGNGNGNGNGEGNGNGNGEGNGNGNGEGHGEGECSGEGNGDEALEHAVRSPTPPKPRPYSGKCPHLAAGTNNIESFNFTRSFELYLPEKPAGAAVMFVYHGLGDTPKNIAEFFGAVTLAKDKGVITVAPNDCCGDGAAECCDQLLVWNSGPYSNLDADAAQFDDILSCLDEQFDIDNSRVYVTGFSAGSIWGTWILLNRADYLAAAVIFSGGVGQPVEYVTPARKVPAVLSWGGEKDIWGGGVVQFFKMMQDLSAGLQEDGHLVVECDHGLGHTVPWGAWTWMSEFMLAHEWSTNPSPFAASGLTPAFPDYCVIPAK